MCLQGRLFIKGKVDKRNPKKGESNMEWKGREWTTADYGNGWTAMASPLNCSIQFAIKDLSVVFFLMDLPFIIKQPSHLHNFLKFP
jgi:hypothetical protein